MYRVNEVLVQMVDVLQDPVLGRAGDRHEVEHGQVLHHLAESDTACVWTDRHPELGGQQQDRDVFVDATDTCRIDLNNVNGVCLQQLLKMTRLATCSPVATLMGDT